MRTVDVLNPLLVPVQKDNHGATGQGNENSKEDFRTHQQYCIERVTDFITPYNRAKSKISFSCHIFTIKFDKRVHKENKIYEHEEDPMEGNGAF